MAEAENKPSIRIHIDQQLAIEAVSGREEVEDVTLSTEITGFDVEGDSYILKGALSLSGFLRQEDETASADELPDAFDDRDVFATEAAAEADLLPVHHRLPFVLQVPVAAQQAHQREDSILSVNPKVSQFNVYVLGEQTLHLRAELILQGLSGQEGYVFRCGTQEEGVAASRLDQLLEQEEARQFAPPETEVVEEFEPPFENAWRAEEDSIEAEASSGPAEDDWVIETPADAHNDQEEERDIVFTPDPDLHFPMPQADSDWIKQLRETDRLFASDESFVSEERVVSPVQPEAVFRAEDSPAEQEQQAADVWDEQAALAAAADPYAQLRQQFHPAVGQEQTLWQPGMTEAFDPYAQVREPFSQSHYQSQDEDEAEFQVPAQPDFSAYWQPPTVSLADVRATEADDDDDAFVVEEERAEAQAPPQEQADPLFVPVAPPVPPAPEQPQAIAEYTFEDEVPKQAPAVSFAEPAVETAEPAAMAGPKVSFGKPRDEQEEPLKLSAVFGSRPAAPEPQLAGESRTSAGIAREMFTRESSSSSAHSSHSSHHAGAAVLLAQPLSKDSIWSGMLGSASETKTTMKFHIVQIQETVPAVAERYNLAIGDLMRVNNLQSQELDLGQILYIPITRR